MPFFEDEIPHLLKQREKRRIRDRAAADPAAKQKAKQVKALSVDYPWLSPGVMVSLVDGGYDPAKAKEIALADLKAQYKESPALFGDVPETNHKKRLKSWIKELDSYAEARRPTAAAPSAFDAAEMNRGARFQGLSDDEVKDLRRTAKAALNSGDGIAMTAALGIINQRSKGGPDPFTQSRATGLTPQAEWVGENVLEPITRATEKVAMPAIRTAALAANTLQEGTSAIVRTAAATAPEGTILDHVGSGGSDYQAPDAVTHGVPHLFSQIAAQTQGGQAVKAALAGEPVDVGGGYLPSPDSATGQAAAEAARRNSAYLLAGHAWTPGRALAGYAFSPDSTAFTVASGLADGWFAINADPTAFALTGLGTVNRASKGFENVADAAGTVARIEAGVPDAIPIFRHSAEPLDTSVRRLQGAYFGFDPTDWPRVGGRGEATIEKVLSPKNALAVSKGEDDAFLGVGELALKKLDPDLHQRLLDLAQDDIGQAVDAAARAGVPFDDATRTFLLEEGSASPLLDMVGGHLARSAGHDAVVARDGVRFSPAEVSVLSDSAFGEAFDADAYRVQLLEDMGIVNGRRPLVRGHNPVHWLYGQGAPIVTKLTEEADPWTIWNATGRKFDPDLVNRLANSTDEGVTRQILASELGTSLDKVPKYQDGLGIKPRFLTDLPSGKLDLADPNGAANLIDDYLVLMKAPEAERQAVFNQLVTSAGRGDDYAVVDAVFDAFEKSMVASGADPAKAAALKRWSRTTWDDAQKWAVDAETGEDVPLRLIIDNGDTLLPEVVDMPAGPWAPFLRFNTTVDMPDPRAVKRLVASPEFQGVMDTKAWAGTVGLTDSAYSAWKVFKLARPAWTVKVVGDEQARIMATGFTSILNHPIQAIAIALGNPQEGTFFGKSFYERLEGIGSKATPAEVKQVADARAARALELVEENPDISRPELFAVLNKEHPIPKSFGERISERLRVEKSKRGRLKTDITGATMDARPGIGGDYAAGLTGRFTDFGVQGVDRKMYLAHFDVADRSSEHWARGLVEDLARLGSEPATRRAAKLSPQEFADEMWSSKWGKHMREQMAAGRDPGDPWLRVLNDRRASDAYAQAYLGQIENLVGNDDALRVALVNGKWDGTALVDDYGRANPEAIDKAKVYQVEGRGPDNVKVQRAVTQRISERESDLKAWKAGVNSVFDALMTRPSNYLSRHPTFMQKYWGDVPQMAPAMSADARAALLKNLDEAALPREMDQQVRAALHRATGTEGMALEDADLILKRRALDFTRGTLYDLSKKSNMMDTLRFVFPFGEAFKEIFTVWAKIGFENPQVPRRLQQGIQGAREAQLDLITGLPTGMNDPDGAGFFRHDPQTGQEVFTLPGTSWLSKIATGGEVIPLKAPVQGLNMVGSLSPGVGPLISIPASYLVPNKPQWDSVREIIFPFGAPETGDPLAIPGTEFAPTWFKNISKVFSDPRSDRLYSNTIMDIAAAKAASGEYAISGDPDSHDEINRLLQDSIKAAKWMYTIRAFSSATSPSSPGFDVYVKENPDNEQLILLQKVRDEYRKMTDEYGYDDGFVKFVEKFGTDNLLATASKSKTNVAGLDTSPEQRDWARSNPDLVASFPETWALFAPTGTDHDQTAYEAQIAAGQRDPVDPRTAAEKANATLAEAIVQNAIDTELGGEVDTAAERQYMRDLKKKLARDYAGYEPEGGMAEYPARIRELERAMENPKVAETDVGYALGAYLDAREQANALARSRGYSEVGAMDAEKASGLRDDLRDYAKVLVKKVPEFRRMWETVLSRELAD